MGMFSSKPRGMTPAEEAARRRGVHIPDDAQANAASSSAAARQPVAPATVTAGPQYETLQIKVDKHGFLGRTTNTQKQIAKLVAEGWEIVDAPSGWHGRPLYTLRRPIR